MYLIDLQTIVLPKSFKFTHAVKTKVNAFKPIQLISEIRNKNPEVYQFLISLGKLYFPIFFGSELIPQSLRLFGFIEMIFCSDVSKSKAELLFFPVDFFDQLKKCMIQNSETFLQNGSEQKLLKLAMERATSVNRNIIGLVHESFSILSNSSIFWKEQLRTLANCSKTKASLVRSFEQMRANFFINHEKSHCFVCSQTNSGLKNFKSNFNSTSFLNNLDDYWQKMRNPITVHITSVWQEKNTIERFYPLLEPSYVCDTIPYGNPFRVIVKRKSEKNGYQVFENDDVEIRHIFEDHIAIREAYNQEKLNTVRKYRQFCDEFDFNVFEENVNKCISDVLQNDFQHLTIKTKNNGIEKEMSVCTYSKSNGTKMIDEMGDYQLKGFLEKSVDQNHEKLLVFGLSVNVQNSFDLKKRGIIENACEEFDRFSAIMVSDEKWIKEKRRLLMDQTKTTSTPLYFRSKRLKLLTGEYLP